MFDKPLQNVIFKNCFQLFFKNYFGKSSKQTLNFIYSIILHFLGKILVLVFIVKEIEKKDLKFSYYYFYNTDFNIIIFLIK